MAYSDTDDTQALIPTQIWSHDAAGANPDDAQVTEWADEVGTEIDGYLAATYSLPIVGVAALALLKSISARLVAIRVWGMTFTGQTGIRDYPKDWDEARRLLERLGSGAASLPGVTPAASTAGQPGAPVSSFRTLVADPLQDTELTPIFSMDRDV